ncbi:MAG: PAS domain S-box-containing protein [Colwellia sp.]|jgi:PAS domain S-box-containing protein
MNYTFRYTGTGIIFGWAFVFAAWAIDLFTAGLMPTPANIIQIHINNLVIFIVDMAPIVLGVSFYYFGKLYQRLYNQYSEEQNSRARFTALMDSAFDAIIIIDDHGLVTDYNAAAEAIFGYKHQEAVGKDLAALIIPHRYREAHNQGLKVFLETGKGPLIGQRVEIEALHHDGHEFAAEVAIEKFNILTNDSSDSAFVGFIRDITKHKDAAAKLIQASKLSTLGEMATSVAHELNQPLNVIRMAAGNSRRKISKGTATYEYLNAKLERIEEQTARAAAIIDHMRMFGREANEELEPINARAVVTNALDLMGEQLRLAGIEIVTEFSEDCLLILGHSIQMEQVILNLLTNAIDAMAKSAGDKKVTLRVFKDDKGVHITAEDTGSGIPEDLLPRIFEPFYTTKEMGKGTGLGLSVSYGIINDMNGTIVADNIDGGARFTITLPSVS